MPENELERLAKPFTPFEIDQMYFNPVLARLNLAELYAALNKAPQNADPKIIGEIKGKIGTVERIIKDLMQAQSTAPVVGEPPIEQMLQNPIFHGGDKEKLKEKQLNNILAAQQKFKEFFEFNFKLGKFIVVDVQGNRINDLKLVEGKPSGIAAFAGDDPKAIAEINQHVEAVYANFARAGFDVRKTEKDGKSFFAVLFPEGLENSDPLTMTKSQIEDALKKKENEMPPKIIDSTTDENDKQAFDKFKKRVSAIAGGQGDSKDVIKFRAEEIANWWKDLVREKKGKTKTSVEQLMAGSQQGVEIPAGR